MSSRLLAVVLPLAALPAAAHASSDAAWASFDAKVARACDRESGLRQPRTGQVVGFDDTLGKVVALTTGLQPVPRGRAIQVSKLCIFDQRNGHAWLSEANGWRSPDRSLDGRGFRGGR